MAVEDLPKKQNVLQVAPIQVGRRSDWVVLSAGPPDPDDDRAIDSANVSLFEPRGQRLRRLSLTRLTAQGFSNDERAGDDSFQHLFLVVADVDGNGHQQACVFGLQSGPPWIEPMQFDLYTPARGKLKKTFEITSNWPIWVQDIDHDGRSEIGVYYEIGDEPKTFEQPRWMDVYAYRHGAYRLADREFPMAYRSMTRILRKALHTYRDDDDLWRHLGEAYDIEGNHRRAREAYRKDDMPESISPPR